jgi:ActR/RegA family two-component response regulator
MDDPRPPKFLIVESDSKYIAWLQHAVATSWPAESVVVMDWSSFGRVRTAMTVRDYDIVMLGLSFEEGIEEPSESLDWIRKLRSQPGFPEMVVLAQGGSELVAVRTLRLGAADYLPKRMLTPGRLQRSLKLTLRAIDKENARRAARTTAVPHPEGDKAAMTMPPLSSTSDVSPASHISTHTAASLARAASMVVKPAEIAPPAPPAPEPAPAPVAVSVKVDGATRDPAAASLPAASLPGISQPAASLPASQGKDSRQSIPEWHRIPGYTILQRIGESEAAAVYLAIAEDIQQNVALKVTKRRHTPGDPAESGERQIAFQREFEAIAALDHSSIIDLYDYGIHDGVEYLAMEYFPCGDLKARLQNPLTADEAIAFVREIARSLKVVHDAGIIHRDLKPPNVMLRDNGNVVLIDFGLARSLLGGDSSTRTGVLRGSPYYMSPEQAQGEVLDARTDLYSLGVILYEMLAGKKPYLGASAIDVLQQHVMAPVPELPIHHLVYQPLLERLMSKSREQRIASCDDLLSALDKMARSFGEGLVDPETLVSAGAES